MKEAEAKEAEDTEMIAGGMGVSGTAARQALRDLVRSAHVEWPARKAVAQRRRS